MSGIAPRIAAASAALVLLAALSACAPEKTPLPLPGESTSAAPPAPTPTASAAQLHMDEANALLSDNLDLTTKSAGGTWTYQDAVVSDCTTAAGEKGGQFTIVANAPGPNDWNTVLGNVGKLWDRLGFTSNVVAANDGAHDRKTTTPDGQVIDFSVGGGGGMSINGVSTCALSSASG